MPNETPNGPNDLLPTLRPNDVGAEVDDVAELERVERRAHRHAPPAALQVTRQAVLHTEAHERQLREVFFVQQRHHRRRRVAEHHFGPEESADAQLRRRRREILGVDQPVRSAIRQPRNGRVVHRLGLATKDRRRVCTLVGWKPGGVAAVYSRSLSSSAAVMLTSSSSNENFDIGDALVRYPSDRFATSTSASGWM